MKIIFAWLFRKTALVALLSVVLVASIAYLPVLRGKYAEIKEEQHRSELLSAFNQAEVNASVEVGEIFVFATDIGKKIEVSATTYGRDRDAELRSLGEDIKAKYPKAPCRDAKDEFFRLVSNETDPETILRDRALCSAVTALNVALAQGIEYQRGLRDSVVIAFASCERKRAAAKVLNDYRLANYRWINVRNDRIWKPAIKMRSTYDEEARRCASALDANKRQSAKVENVKASIDSIRVLPQRQQVFMAEMRQQLNYRADGALAALVRIARENLGKIAFIAFLVFFSKPLRKAAVYFVGSRVVTSKKGLALVEPKADLRISSPEVSEAKDSLDVFLRPEEAVYVRPEFLQVVPECGKKGTRWIFDWRSPLTSLAARLSSLTKISETGDALVRLVPRTSMTATLSEISLTKDHALSVRAGSIVAVVADPRSIPHFRKIWRLWSWQSWLSGRFRHLVVTGPCRIVVEGSHTLLVDRVSGTRQFEEAAIVAFSADLAMNMVRTETFGAYLTDARDAFQKTLAGHEGIVVYQRVTKDTSDSVDGTSRSSGFEMAIDVCLSALGI